MRFVALAALLLCAPAHAEEPTWVSAEAVTREIGPLRLDAEAATTSPLEGSGRAAGRIVLTLPLGELAFRSWAQAEARKDPEAATGIGLRWHSIALECVVPELEADPWQGAPSPRAVLTWSGAW